MVTPEATPPALRGTETVIVGGVGLGRVVDGRVVDGRVVSGTVVAGTNTVRDWFPVASPPVVRQSSVTR